MTSAPFTLRFLATGFSWPNPEALNVLIHWRVNSRPMRGDRGARQPSRTINTDFGPREVELIFALPIKPSNCSESDR
jgi:hypothetical protein